jgi:hypothetical protein
MITHIILLGSPEDTRVSEAIVDGRYWVLNVPWSADQPKVSIRRSGNEIHVESEDTVCRTCDGVVMELESIHRVSPRIEFLQMALPDLSSDFSLVKRQFTRRLRGEVPLGDEAMYLERRSLMRFVSPLFLYCFRDAVCALVVNMPGQVTEYIVSQPMKIKQNTAIKQILGVAAKMACAWQRRVLDSQVPLIFVNRVFLLPMYCWLCAFTAAYSSLLVAFKETLHLLKNSSYNPLKKRNDCANLATDQIFLTVLLFSLFLFLIINMVCFYVLFAGIRLLLTALRFFESFIDFMLVDTSRCRIHALEPGKDEHVRIVSRKVGLRDKLGFALGAASCECGISSGRFVVSILTGLE